MTERNLPTEEQEDYKTWTKYFFVRLAAAGVPVELDTTELDCGGAANQVRLFYDVSSPRYSVSCEARFNAAGFESAKGLSDVVDEEITFGISPNNITMNFYIKENQATIVIEDLGTEYDIEQIPFVNGETYHAKEVIDTLIEIILQDLKNGPPAERG